MDAISKEGFLEKYVFAPTFIVYRGEINCSETFSSSVNFIQKQLIPYENNTTDFHKWRENVAAYLENWETV